MPPQNTGGLPPSSRDRPFHPRAAVQRKFRPHDGPSGWSSYVNPWRCQLEYHGMRWDQLWNPMKSNENLWKPHEILMEDIWHVKTMRIQVAQETLSSQKLVKFGGKAMV